MTKQLSPAEWTRLFADSGAAAFAVSREDFVVWLTDLQQRGATLESVRLEEFVLARACAQGNAAAWDCFITRYRPKLYAAAMAIARDDVRGRELADSLYAELYGTGVREEVGRVSKLDSYLGRGSLEGWLKTVLAQEYVNRIRKERRLVAFDDTLETPVQTEMGDPALSSHLHALTVATDAALTQLTEEERFLLASYYLDKRTLAEIGRMLGTHESTVSRRIEKLTARLRKDIVGRLCKTGMLKRAAEEMMDLDVRDLAINVREKLAQERRA